MPRAVLYDPHFPPEYPRQIVPPQDVHRQILIAREQGKPIREGLHVSPEANYDSPAAESTQDLLRRQNPRQPHYPHLHGETCQQGARWWQGAARDCSPHLLSRKSRNLSIPRDFFSYFPSPLRNQKWAIISSSRENFRESLSPSLRREW